jgi:hypothetical protein
MVVYSCHPSDGRKLKIEDSYPGQPGQEARPDLQNNQSKKI